MGLDLEKVLDALATRRSRSTDSTPVLVGLWDCCVWFYNAQHASKDYSVNYALLGIGALASSSILCTILLILSKVLSHSKLDLDMMPTDLAYLAIFCLSLGLLYFYKQAVQNGNKVKFRLCWTFIVITWALSVAYLAYIVEYVFIAQDRLNDYVSVILFSFGSTFELMGGMFFIGFSVNYCCYLYWRHDAKPGPPKLHQRQNMRSHVINFEH